MKLVEGVYENLVNNEIEQEMLQICNANLLCKEEELYCKRSCFVHFAKVMSFFTTEDTEGTEEKFSLYFARK